VFWGSPASDRLMPNFGESRQDDDATRTRCSRWISQDRRSIGRPGMSLCIPAQKKQADIWNAAILAALPGSSKSRLEAGVCILRFDNDISQGKSLSGKVEGDWRYQAGVSS